MTFSFVLVQELNSLSQLYIQQRITEDDFLPGSIDSFSYDYGDRITVNLPMENIKLAQALLYQLFHMAHQLVNEMLKRYMPEDCVLYILRYIEKIQHLHCRVVDLLMSDQENMNVWVADTLLYQKNVNPVNDSAVRENEKDIYELWCKLLSFIEYTRSGKHFLERTQLIPSQFLLMLSQPLGRYFLRKIVKLCECKAVKLTFSAGRDFSFDQRRLVIKYKLNHKVAAFVQGDYDYGINEQHNLQMYSSPIWIALAHELLHWRICVKTNSIYSMPFSDNDDSFVWSNLEEQHVIARSHCSETKMGRLIGLPDRLSHQAWLEGELDLGYQALHNKDIMTPMVLSYQRLQQSLAVCQKVS
tara:strand:+ start:49317 stop:50387 length:1071 start_codon:yes stop_codon:yes gene_type:complete